MNENSRPLNTYTRPARLIEIAVIIVTGFIAIAFTEQAVANNVFFVWLVTMVGSIVPLVHGISAASPTPGMTSTIIAINWLVMPVYFVLIVMETAFWKEDVANKVAVFVKQAGLVKTFVFMPSIFMWWVLSNFGLIPGPGMFLMSDYAGFVNFGLNQVVHQHPLAIAALYFGMIFCQALMYSYVVTMALGTAIYFLRRFNLIKHSHAA